MFKRLSSRASRSEKPIDINNPSFLSKNENKSQHINKKEATKAVLLYEVLQHFKQTSTGTQKVSHQHWSSLHQTLQDSATGNQTLEYRGPKRASCWHTAKSNYQKKLFPELFPNYRSDRFVDINNKDMEDLAIEELTALIKAINSTIDAINDKDKQDLADFAAQPIEQIIKQHLGENQNIKALFQQRHTQSINATSKPRSFSSPPTSPVAPHRQYSKNQDASTTTTATTAATAAFALQFSGTDSELDLSSMPKRPVPQPPTSTDQAVNNDNASTDVTGGNEMPPPPTPARHKAQKLRIPQRTAPTPPVSNQTTTTNTADKDVGRVRFDLGNQKIVRARSDSAPPTTPDTGRHKTGKSSHADITNRIGGGSAAHRSANREKPDSQQRPTEERPSRQTTRRNAMLSLLDPNLDQQGMTKQQEQQNESATTTEDSYMTPNPI